MVGITVMLAPSILTSTFGGSLRDELPFGPLASMTPLFNVAETPLGITTGRVPIRVWGRSVSFPFSAVACWLACWFMMRSPNLAEELAADALLTRFFVGQNSAAGRKDRDAHARANLRDLIMCNIHASARARN